MVSRRALGCGLLAAGPIALLGLLLAEPPAPGPRQGEAAPLRPGARLPVLNLTANAPSSWTTGRTVYLLGEAGEGIPTEDIYGLAVYRLPPLPEGHVRVRTKYISIDPGPMRGRLGHSGVTFPAIDPADPNAIGHLLLRYVAAEAVGIVEESRAQDLPVGTVVRGGWGMSELVQMPASDVHALPERHLPPSLALGALGGTGRTAYYGVTRILMPKPGETLLVTGAAGATGSVAGQLGKIAGCRVIGSAGTAAKVRHLVEALGFDAAFNYREEDPAEALARLAPNGIDLFFENTGGPVSEAAFRRLNRGARVAVSGLINWYHAPTSGLRGVRSLLPSSLSAALASLASPAEIPEQFWAKWLSLRMNGWHGLIGHCDRNLVRKSTSVGKAQFTVEHFLVPCIDMQDNWNAQKSAEAALAGYVREGRLRAEETVLRGTLEDAPRAAINVWAGGNTGKQLIELV